MRILLTRIVPAALLAAFLAAAPAAPSAAGCGCTKPPPPPAAVRPAATWAGSEVTLFDDALVAGQSYWVEFRSGVAVHSAQLTATAVLRRDLADGEMRPQLAVALPALPLGPARIRVFRLPSTHVLTIPDDAFTVAPQPVGVPSGVGTYRFENYRAAVARDGTAYLSLHFGDVQHARVFDARAEGWPLRFDNEGLAFYNAQGFLMQLLGEGMPGLFAISAAGSGDSDALHYSRHEFNTYFLQHDERQSHAVDPSDPNWHQDGTPHIDHDRQLLAIEGTVGGAQPAPGASPPFTLVVDTETLFQHGVVGESSVLVDNHAHVRSYDSLLGLLGLDGDVLSNGLVTVSNFGFVHGSATASDFSIESGGLVLGGLHDIDPPVSFLPVAVPSGLVPLGDLVLEGPMALGPGSYEAGKLEVRDGGHLQIQNADGPVTLYVTEEFRVDHGGKVQPEDIDPEKFAVYVAGAGRARFSDDSSFFGVVYGPDAEVRVDNGGTFAGALVGGDVSVENDAVVFYDVRLHRNECPADPPALVLPDADELEPGRLLDLPGLLEEALTGYGLRIDGRTVPLLPSVLGALVTLPQDLKPGTDVEFTLVDPNGCRTWRTRMMRVEEPDEPPPACGLLGIEFLLAFPLARALARPRRRQAP